MSQSAPPSPYPPAPWQTTPFTDAELGDIIRFAGFGTLDGYGFLFGGNALANMVFILSQMTDARMVTVRTIYLAPLAIMEAAIDSAGNNLTAAQAAVYTHNANEVSDRTRLFNQKRRGLCAFIGVAPGDALAGGSAVIRT